MKLFKRNLFCGHCGERCPGTCPEGRKSAKRVKAQLDRVNKILRKHGVREMA